MRAIELSAILALFLAARAATAADPAADALAVLSRMAESLAEPNPRRFQRQLSPDAAGMPALAESAQALAQQYEVISSVEILRNTGDTSRREIQADWTLRFRLRDFESAFQQRRRVLKLVLIRTPRGWKLQSVDHPPFFAPPL
ncbi:MAG: hypothetical protein K2X35_15665 [Bryobacteraceae bacterium]|nr:hypothetical protein [Bryobacteraceae bacterium]